MSPPITSVFLLHIKWWQVVCIVSWWDCIIGFLSWQDNGPIFTRSYKVKVCSRLCILLFFFPPLAQTSVYSNIIFCEVSWGEKQFGHPHCYLTRRLCWMQQTPRVTVLSILETPDTCLISSPFYLQASLITPPPLFFFILSTILRQGLISFLSHLLSPPLSVLPPSLFCWMLWLSHFLLIHWPFPLSSLWNKPPLSQKQNKANRNTSAKLTH